MPNGDPVSGLLTTKTNIHSCVYPWPSPTYYYWPPSTYHTVSSDYANEVEVTRGEHDATLRFYRKAGSGRSFVKEVTVPLALLDAIGGEA